MVKSQAAIYYRVCMEKSENFIPEDKEQYRLLVELCPDAIMIQVEDKIAFINAAGARLLGAEDPEKLIGKSFWEFVSQPQREIVAERFRQLTGKGTKASLDEFKLLRLDGTSIVLEGTAIPFTYQGQPAIQAVLRNITGREWTKDELAKLRQAVETSGEVIFLTNREGIITYVNPEFTRVYGYPSEDVVGKTTPRILKSGRMTQQRYKRFWETLLDKQVVKGEFVNKCKDGQLVYIEGSANPILDEQENIIGFLAIQRDITQRKQAEEALEKAHEFQQSIIDGVPDPLMVIGKDYQVKMMNRAARQFSSGDSNLSGPLYCYQISHHRESPCNGTAHPCPLQQVRDLGRPVTVVHEHFQANGEPRFVEVVVAPLKKAGGGFEGIIESMRDITVRKQAEEALQQYAQRLRALSAQLAEVEDSERQRLARELHDQVGQNLTAIGINLNIARSQVPEQDAPVVHYHLNDALSLVDQTTEQIRNVMADLRPPVLDDYGIVAALRWFGEQFAQRTGVNVIVEGEEPSPRLPARVEITLFRVAQEALTNVAKHAQAKHSVVKVEVDHNILRMIVADDGIGFDPKHLAEPGRERGWGLLSMKERAEAVNGNFRIETAPNLGTQVIVEVLR